MQKIKYVVAPIHKLLLDSDGREIRQIPKFLHQTFHSKVLPLEIQQNIEAIKLLNPDWQYTLYDNDDIVKFISEHFDSSILTRYNSINPIYGAARADLFRYLLLYKLGGVYLDIKSALSRPLDDVLMPADKYLLSNWRNKEGDEHEGWGNHPAVSSITGGEYQQWHICASAGHPFLKAVIEKVLTNIDRYNPAIHGTGRDGVLTLTGPIAYTLAIAPLLSQYEYRIVDSMADLGFEYSIYKNFGHKSIFKNHYTKLDESIIYITGLRKLIASFIYGLKGIKAFIFRK